ncbi:MAG: hypothetical protein RIC14_11810 [Filomicrobium sp.]
MKFAAGQEWTYKTPQGYESSRIVIGAVATCGDGNQIICFSVYDAPSSQADGGTEAVTIPFVPMSETAFAGTVMDLTGEREPPDDFSEALKAWSEDPRGLTVFTVPFEGAVDRMIALQMAAIVGKPAA